MKSRRYRNTSTLQIDKMLQESGFDIKKTVNNTHENNLKSLGVYAARALLIALIAWLIIHCILTASIFEETKQEREMNSLRVEHSDKGMIEENKYLDILIIKK